jgi:hypothetical protein
MRQTILFIIIVLFIGVLYLLAYTNKSTEPPYDYDTPESSSEILPDYNYSVGTKD